jgi:carbamoyl-phosphate synthase large subunit
LTNSEYHKLREIAIKVIRHLGIVGECNIQYALDPDSEDYRIIEVNARLSRSSALASKATGYPLAYIAAKLAIGYSLTEIENKITKKTKACFEPSLDYCVVKVPRWDLKKFKEVDKRIGSEMKSVGEVMSIGRKFEEALQKALRMIGIGTHGVTQNSVRIKDIDRELQDPTDKRVFAVAEALKQGRSIDQIFDITKIDKWFLYKIKNIIDCEKDIRVSNLNKELLLHAKQLGFSDRQIAMIRNRRPLEIRQLRKKAAEEDARSASLHKADRHFGGGIPCKDELPLSDL